MNGYFQLINENDKTYLKLFPPTDGGAKIEIDEIMNYFQVHNMVDCDLLEVNRNLNNLTEEKVIKVSDKSNYHINEYMAVRISEDKMAAFVKFYPESNDGERISLEEMKRDLQLKGIKYGIDYSVLKNQIEKPVYCTEYLIAKGKAVRQGKDAYIEYMFNADRKAKPRKKDDGSVDFHQLDNINHICKGELLAVLHPVDVGENGINVLNEIVKPVSVEKKVLKYGKNISISEDKLQIFSNIDGHVSMHNEQVFVSNVYDVPADVDNSTGDIQYEGNVLVHGSVRTGFKIRASGNIEVLGSVEGSELISGGDIILHHGIQGMGKGKVVAKGNIITKFIESSRVFAGGYIESNAIIQSQVSAMDEIVVDGSKGHIVGGHIRSSNLVCAKIIGSGMGITTSVEVGYDPGLLDSINNLKEQISEKSEEIKKCSQVVEVLTKKFRSGIISEDQKINYKKNLEKLKILNKEVSEEEKEYEEKLSLKQNNKDACIKVQRTIYPGTQLIISGDCYNILKEDNYCKYVKKEGMIVSLPL